MAKTEQLQIRVTPAEKRRLRQLAHRAGQDVSAYVLERVLPSAARTFAALIEALHASSEASVPLAELNDFLSAATAGELTRGVAVAPPELWRLPPLLQNYVAAMVEQGCYARDVATPDWVADVPPLEAPWFAGGMPGLRLYLLGAAPVPFKRRNLFVDTALGGRV